MRLFIAIEPVEEIQAALNQVQTVLNRAPSKIKWVDPANIHLTLRFLGETSEEKLEELKTALNQVTKKTKPFELSLGQLGAFPKLHSPRVVWVGLNQGRKETIQISQNIKEAIAPLKFKKEEREFHPHLTLGRVKFIKDKSRLIRTLKSPTLQPKAKMHVTSISLIQSTLSDTGPTYNTLHNIGLKS